MAFQISNILLKFQRTEFWSFFFIVLNLRKTDDVNTDIYQNHCTFLHAMTVSMTCFSDTQYGTKYDML